RRPLLPGVQRLAQQEAAKSRGRRGRAPVEERVLIPARFGHQAHCPAEALGRIAPTSEQDDPYFTKDPRPMELTKTTFAELERFASGFVTKPIQLLLVVGNPGLQKSTIVRNAVGERVRWIDSTITGFRFYCELWQYRGWPFVLDDVDSLYSDRAAVRVLKA